MGDSTGENVIVFAPDGSCAHTRFNGTYELDGKTVTVTTPMRKLVLTFDFENGFFEGDDGVLKQHITGRRTEQRGPREVLDAQLEKLTRGSWTWETVMGQNTIRFEKDRTCVHTRFKGTFEVEPDDTVTVKLPAREQVLVFNFERGEYTGYDLTLKQKISGRRVAP